MISYIEQIKLIIYFVIYGLFIGCTYDTLKFATKNYKLIIKYVLEILYWGIILIITYYYIINIQKGFINLYTIIFYVLGLIFYYLILAESHHKRLEWIKKIYNRYIKKLIIYIIFPVEVTNVILKIIKKIKLKKIFNIFKKNT